MFGKEAAEAAEVLRVEIKALPQRPLQERLAETRPLLRVLRERHRNEEAAEAVAPHRGAAWLVRAEAEEDRALRRNTRP